MKVLFGLRVSPELKGLYRNELPDEIDLIFPKEINEETLLSLAPDVEILVAYKLSSKFMKKANKLKHIQVPWTGSETLDFELLRKYPHITVSNSHSNSLAIAEHAVSLLLSAAKRIPYRDSRMRKGDWSPRYNDLNSYWLTGKTLGIIGYGAIGQKVGRILKNGFNMKVFAIKRDPSKINEEVQPDFLGGPKDLSYILSESDFILISLPKTSETEGIIGRSEFQLMKESVIICNISRGSIINEQDLFEHLKENKHAIAALDVWYNYPQDRKNPINVFQNHPFEELDNVVMSPHSAFKVHEREAAFAEDIITNIMLVMRNEDPINRLNLDLGY
ncbi:MAG: 2-hydroxyacid dehydrogenase [Candidatus Thorarchaeota archaeon]